MVKIAAAFVLALLIGAGCRWLNIPLPAPPTFIGALLIVAITAGYSTTDYLMGRAAKGSERSNVNRTSDDRFAGSRTSWRSSPLRASFSTRYALGSPCSVSLNRFSGSWVPAAPRQIVRPGAQFYIWS